VSAKVHGQIYISNGFFDRSKYGRVAFLWRERREGQEFESKA
jgi:hypothetical protein